MHRKDGQSNTSAKALPPRNFRLASGDIFIIGVIVLFCAILIGGMFIHRKVHSGDAQRMSRTPSFTHLKKHMSWTAAVRIRSACIRATLRLPVTAPSVFRTVS